MASASHFAKEVHLNMTALAELLESCSDTVFTCQFHKLATPEHVFEKLDAVSLKDLKDPK